MVEKKATSKAKKTTRAATAKAEVTQTFKRTMTGVVVSDKSSKTVVVLVNSKTMHPKYKKFVLKSKKYHVHDEKEQASTGNTVEIIESRPHSKLKRWELHSIIK